MSEALKDNVGRVIGLLDDQGSRVTLRDNVGRVLGSYDKGTNATRDNVGRVVGKGNLLARLLDRDR